MKNKFMRKTLYLILTCSIFIFASCAQPTPLTGTWADNRGDQLTLRPDYSYTAKITNEYEENHTYTGSYSVLLNALSFTASNGYQVVSEWDIRGNMLYLEWPDSKGKKLQLTLYKTKN